MTVCVVLTERRKETAGVDNALPEKTAKKSGENLTGSLAAWHKLFLVLMLFQHRLTQHGVQAFLIAFAWSLKPSQHIRIDSDGF